MQAVLRVFCVVLTCSYLDYRINHAKVQSIFIIAMIGKDKYGLGIERAIEEGLIEIHGGKFPEDAFAHYNGDLEKRMGISHVNSRILRPIQREIAKTFPGKFRYLELGAGAGVSAASMAELPTAEVHTVGLTPINPYLDFNIKGYGWGEIESLVENFLRFFEYQFQYNPDYLRYSRRSKVPPQIILDKQSSLGIPFFLEREIPFIKKQFIGSFPDEFQGDGISYDFISDDCGPCMHAPVERTTIARDISRILSPRGIFYVSMADYCKADLADTIKVHDGGHAVFMKERNPLFEVVGGKDLQVQNLRKFIADCVERTFS